MKKMEYDVVILGGVAAGTSAAASAKRVKKDLKIAIFQKEPYISYGGCGLPYVISGDVKSPESVIALTPEIFKEKKGADVFVNHEAYEIDFSNKIVYVKSDNGEIEVSYNKLVIATGASPIIPAFRAWGENGIFKLRNPDDAKNILKYINENNPKNAVVIGGGFIGIETAEALKKHNIGITIIEGTDHVLGNIEPEIHEEFVNGLKEKGVKILFNTFADDIIKENDKFKVITKNGNFESDMIIVSIGVKPNTLFLKEKGLNMARNGAIIVNENMETNIKDVYSAGDCATVNHFITKENVYIPLGTTANKQGRIAGKNLAGDDDSFIGVVGSLITKFEDVEYAKTGLTLKEAIEKGFDADSVFIKSGSRAHYYTGSKKIKIKLVFEKKTGRILGAQLIGGEIHPRLNTITSLIYTNGTVSQLRNMDLAYSPPFSPVWDIDLVAATQAVKKL
ncbi:NADPH-dependent 2,4-dienoyl-CoA reductase, sulfur reductase [Marinitoga hydrogenitolerans DSM 16785]|uniref:NADPH-dependent 2,4-dienoyl-CoA reductase, sulfur reductase n=1 Tax=Marinitoga hydrogenitolerans (strain DSM 16785 / JCM 12826 / AT1271) TaxID=1122195 RepID=A0A1M4S5P9_MARH1|nr:FAD-dependent oxidoreductase [Marinitoga hydrogenitolerans]SHE27526.1 NADPH-dependent 2,4-dienoyl-CoA reductase, sulfur reductase [Marinitoga hydrogenitolerans DSM 16785]